MIDLQLTFSFSILACYVSFAQVMWPYLGETLMLAELSGRPICQLTLILARFLRGVCATPRTVTMPFALSFPMSETLMPCEVSVGSGYRTAHMRLQLIHRLLVSSRTLVHPSELPRSRKPARQLGPRHPMKLHGQPLSHLTSSPFSDILRVLNGQ